MPVRFQFPSDICRSQFGQVQEFNVGLSELSGFKAKKVMIQVPNAIDTVVR